MTCKEIDNLLPACEEGILTPEEKKSVDAHLAACERCRRSLAGLRRAREALRGLGEVEPPPFFEERIMSRVRQEARGRQGLLRKLFYPLYIKIPIQALATVLVAVLALHLYQEGDVEMKQVAPLPIPLTAPAKERAAAEFPGVAGAPEAVAPARPPAGDISGTTGQRFAAPPSEGGGKRVEMADSAPVREERPADTIREKSQAAETSPPERMAKRADHEAAIPGVAEEGAGRRKGGKLEADPGRAALRQEAGRAPASPAPERQAKARMADVGVTAGEGRSMRAAPAPGQVALSGLIERSTVELTIHVADVNVAIQLIEKRLGEADARIVERQHRGEEEFLRAEMAAGRVTSLLGQLAAIGRVNVLKEVSGRTDGTVTVDITVDCRP